MTSLVMTIKSLGWTCCEWQKRNSGSWRIIDERTDCSMLSGGEFLPFVNGAFHWLGILSKLCVVSLNISSEVYREIPLPEVKLMWVYQS